MELFKQVNKLLIILQVIIHLNHFPIVFLGNQNCEENKHIKHIYLVLKVDILLHICSFLILQQLFHLSILHFFHKW